MRQLYQKCELMEEERKESETSQKQFEENKAEVIGDKGLHCIQSMVMYSISKIPCSNSRTPHKVEQKAVFMVTMKPTLEESGEKYSCV